MPQLSGHCLCGKVSYSADAEPVMTVACHCEHCQRQTGTSFSIIVGIPDEALTFGNDETLKAYNDTGESGHSVHRRFCSNCGSPIVTNVDTVPGLTFIKAGTLNDKSWLQPASHIWCDSAQSWLDLGVEIPRFGRNPG